MRRVLQCAVLLFVFSSLITGGALATPTTATFKSTGAEQRYRVPSGVKLVAVEAQGGWGAGVGGGPGAYTQVVGQNGAAWQGLLPVTPHQTLYVEVGSNGKMNGGATFGGGGPAGTPDQEGDPGASGAGASDIRTCSEKSHCPDSRLIVAGGAGGNGGGEITTGAGLVCRPGQGGASATNEQQPLPKGNPATGPVPIVTAKGIVIPGYATGDHFTPTTSAGITDAGGGSTKPGKGGSGTSCAGGGAYQGNTYSGSVPGHAGSGPNGGAGGNGAGLKAQPCGTPGKCNNAGPGGGGGGGYFGGGGGVTGFNTCTGPGGSFCGVTDGFGGGAGSSFIAKRILYPLPGDIGGLGTAVPYVKIAPVLSIATPANGAVYHAGSVVHASWSCTEPPGWGYGVQNCTATTASGGAIDTKPGKHTFAVHGIAQNPNEPVTIKVTYTVR